MSASPEPRVTHRLLLAVVAATAIVAVAGMVLLWPRDLPEPDDVAGQRTELLDATLLEVEDLPGEEVPGLLPEAEEVLVTARLEASGEIVAFRMIDETGDTFRAGQRVKLQAISTEGQETAYVISDFRRERPLVLLTALFLVAVLALGRFQGVRALAGLALTFLVIIGFVIPAILSGRPPTPVALVGALAIMLVTLYLSHGVSAKTSAAVVGTAAALLLTGLLALAFVHAANLTGFTSEEARLVTVEVGGLSLRGLLLAGIIIGGLGVLDDVTMSQASTVFELHRTDSNLGFRRLFASGLSVGRDHVAATVNTLFLAYAGASLPLLLLFAVGVDSAGTVVTAEIVAVEVVRTLVGSIGLIAAVPLTTALAAAVAVTDARPAPATGHHEGWSEPAARRSAAPDADAGGDEDEAWLQRLRQAYRLPPEDRGR